MSLWADENISVLENIMDLQQDSKTLHRATDSPGTSQSPSKVFIYTDNMASNGKKSHRENNHTKESLTKDYESYEYNNTAHSDDDNRWHELQISRRLVIKRKIKEYSNSFTLHGLTKIVTGENIESLFWFIMLFGGLLSCFFVIHGLVTKFYRYEIYTEIRSIISDENNFPSVTFCENQLFIDNYFSYCGVAPRFLHSRGDKVCTRMMNHAEGNVSQIRNRYWSNGLFNVTKCVTWGGKECANSDYLRTMHHFNHSCFTWNYEGNLSDIYSHAQLEFDFFPPHWLDKEEVLIALPHDHTVHEIDITKKVEIEPNKAYEIKLDKTLITRLPSPFPSKCSYSKGEDIFPGRYTRRSCIESHNFIEMYKKCGDTLDYVDQFIPAAIKKNYQRNSTIKEAETCIWTYTKGGTQKTSECEFPCNDYDLSVIHSFNERKNPSQKRKNARYTISIQYQKVDTYQTMEEKELYTWDQMLSEMGGLIGLIIGASVISFVEIIVYVFLVIIKKCCC